MILTLKSRTESFEDWKRKRCNLGIHFKSVTFSKHSKRRNVICTRCNKRLN